MKFNTFFAKVNLDKSQAAFPFKNARSAPSQSDKNPLFSALCIFILVLGWMVLLTQGFPFADPDDWDHILASEDTPWTLMLRNFIVPWSTAQEWDAQTNLTDQTTSRRLVQGIALKMIQAFFGYHPFPYYFFTKSIFFSGSICILFILLRNMTQSYWYALAGVLFLVFVPAYYSHALWISVPETMVHFFVLAAIAIYLSLTRQLDQRRYGPSYWRWLFLLLAVGWTGMKTKETALILPLALGAFTLIRFLDWKTFNKYTVSLLLVIGFLTFLFIPMEQDTFGSGLDRAFRWETVYRMMFRNYEVGYEDEATTAFFSRGHVWPVSVARTFGFSLLWALVAAIILYWIQKVRGKIKKIDFFLEDPLVGVSMCWIIIELALIGLFQPDPRYFSGTMIPLTIVAVRIVRVATQSQKFPWKQGTILLVTLALMETLYHNFQHTVWLRQKIGQRGHRFLNSARVVYLDQFPNRKIMTREFGLYYCPSYLIHAGDHPRLHDVVYHADLGYEAINKTGSGSLSNFERYAKGGAPYYISMQPKELFNYPNAALLEVLTGINQESFFERALYHLKKKKPGPMYIFKHR